MRKLITTIISAVLGFGLIQAQTVYFWHNNVALAVEASAAGDMIYSDNGQNLTVIDSVMNVQEIDSITIGAAATENTVQITWHDTYATAVVPFAIARTERIVIDGAYVTANSTNTGTNEITYSLSGKSLNGAFNQNGSFKCTLQLNGLELTSQKGAAINVINGKRIKVKLKKGTTNTFVDNAGGTQKACFYVKGHAEFKGGGTLNVTGNTKHAISTSEYTEVKSGNINILGSISDGMHAGQYFLMQSGSIKMRGVKGDGIQAETSTDPDEQLRGQLLIKGGTVDILINSDDVKGIRSDSLMTLSGGNIKIVVNGAGVKGVDSDTDIIMNEADTTLKVDVEVNGGIYHDNLPDESKTRGIHANGDFNISAGTLNVKGTGRKYKSIKVDGFARKTGTASVTTDDGFVFD